jgi:hypothetical protein
MEEISDNQTMVELASDNQLEGGVIYYVVFGELVEGDKDIYGGRKPSYWNTVFYQYTPGKLISRMEVIGKIFKQMEE